MSEHHLPSADELLPMVQMLLDHLRAKPPGATASGAYLPRDKVLGALNGKPVNGLVVILSTDPEVVQQEVRRAQRALARDPRDVSATEFRG